MAPLKRVVIVGRPNVGKSTLFNRLVGSRRALIHDLPGMTRDRLTIVADLDDGRRYELTDTGGLEYGDSPLSAYAPEIRAQTTRAVDAADLILLLVDGASGVMAEDRDIATELRPNAARVLLLVNRTDRRDVGENAPEFYELGFNELIPISAEHGAGVDEVVDAISAIVPEESGEEQPETDEPVRIAIIGRPNVGKSSLLNRLTSEERAVGSPISGTTRDPITPEIQPNGRRSVIVDTARIRSM